MNEINAGRRSFLKLFGLGVVGAAGGAALLGDNVIPTPTAPDITTPLVGRGLTTPLVVMDELGYVFNSRAARQEAFGEAFFPTVVIGPDSFRLYKDNLSHLGM